MSDTSLADYVKWLSKINGADPVGVHIALQDGCVLFRVSQDRYRKAMEHAEACETCATTIVSLRLTRHA